MVLFEIFLIFFGVRLVTCDQSDMRLTTKQIIHKYGYPIEKHEVVTDDGYMLTMMRIPHGKHGSGVNKKPVLLMHGLYGQCENFIVSGMKNASLAYFLADNNFDVWLGNTRGNQHSRKHKYMNPNRKEFWNFSYHEIGMYDIPAKIDYILEKTKKKKIYYVGHSQGGTSFYIMNSERPEYQKKIIVASLLAPAGFMNHFTNPVLLPLAKAHRDLTALAQRLNFDELPPREISIPNFLHMVCSTSLFREFCVTMYHTIVNGGDSGELDKNMLPLIMRYVPSVSVKQPLHYAQAIKSGRFRQWDYGAKQNMKIYGTLEPPDYNVKNISTPIAIFYSQGDNLVNMKDVEDICHMLPNCMKQFLISNEKWTHLDFLFATNGLKMLHNPLLTFLKKFDKT